MHVDAGLLAFGGGLVVIAGIAAVVALYILPWILAKVRDMEGTGILLLVNILVGWSLIGWVVCLVWAVVGQTKAQARFFANAGRIPSERIEPTFTRHS